MSETVAPDAEGPDAADQSGGDEDGESETVLCCPACEASDVRPRQPQSPMSKSPHTKKWHCTGCGHRFDEPDERPADGPATICGLPRRLYEAEADDVSRETARVANREGTDV